MKKSSLLLLAALFFFAFNIRAQSTKELYMPKEIKQAYENGSRSYEGIPGKNYFVNNADYMIKAEFNPETRELTGEEIITYSNNSPDTLKKMYFNIYQDIFKKGNMRDWDIGPVDIHDGVQITMIKYKNVELDLNSRDVRNYASMLRLNLPEVIAPGEQTTIEIHWHFTLPGTIPIRMGTYGDKNFFVAYWFPKVAVYDDIIGWNTAGHSGNQEFYNDFGSYEVEITVPGEYNVWSTGILQNMNDLYTEKFIKRILNSRKTNDIVHIITSEDRESGGILKNAEKHIWKFKSENTPDLAFAVSKSYLWDATSILSGSEHISVNAVYKPDSKDFHEVAEIGRNVLDFYTNEIPGIPYPYPQVTAFNGGGGMEFPGMVNDGDADTRNGTLYLTAHEIGHSYYPFCTGLNEQKYAWMDEGLISFFPRLFVEKYTNEESYDPFKVNIDVYNKFAGGFNDVPLMISTDNIGRYAYRFHAYSKPAVAFTLLYNYLGKEMFTKGLQLFTTRWKSKHPTPYDFFFTFNEVAKEDLAWFWKPWFFEIGYADLSIEKIDYTDNMRIIVHIKNRTGFPVQVNLKAYYKDGKTIEFNKDMSEWKDKDEILIPVPDKNIVKLELNTANAPDVYPENNTYNF